MDLGEAIKKRRIKQGFTLKTLYHETGIPDTRLGDMEVHAEAKPATSNEFERIAKALKLEPEELLFLSLEPADLEGKSLDEMKPVVLKLLKLFKDR